MARRQPRPPATLQRHLAPHRRECWACGHPLWMLYQTARTVATVEGVCHLTLTVRCCVQPTCPLYQRPYRPEEEIAVALPHGAFGLDVIALIGALRYGEHRSVPEIHRTLQARGIQIAERTVTYLIERYEELVTVRLADRTRLSDVSVEQQYGARVLDVRAGASAHCPRPLLAQSLLNERRVPLGVGLKLSVPGSGFAAFSRECSLDIDDRPTVALRNRPHTTLIGAAAVRSDERIHLALLGLGQSAVPPDIVEFMQTVILRGVEHIIHDFVAFLRGENLLQPNVEDGRDCPGEFHIQATDPRWTRLARERPHIGRKTETVGDG